MPQTRGAIRKLRSDKKKAAVNLKTRRLLVSVVAAVRRKPSAKALKEAFVRIDKSVGKKIIHKNKAARLKSRLAKLVTTK
jgi:small subunit ribosomal protein S20